MKPQGTIAILPMSERSLSTVRFAIACALLLGATELGLAQPQKVTPPMPVGRAPAQATAAPAATSAAPAVIPAPPPEWSGTSGSSGHPLMQASAIRAAAAHFESCLEGLWPLAQQAQHLARELRQIRAGADARSAHHGFDGRAAGVHQGVLGLSRHPGERCAHRHRARDSRQAQGDLRQGREGLRRRSPHHHRDLGRRIRTTARSAATGRCCARPRRSPASAAARPISATNSSPRWKSCIAAISSPAQLVGSWAGAFGPTQFMPTSFKRYAVDFDGDGRRDVVDSAADLIASTANNLKKDGWVPGETWGYEVVIPKGFNYLLADRSKQLTLAEWQAHGIKRAGNKPFPHPHEKRLSAGAGRQSGSGLPDAAQLSRHHEIQSGGGLCAGDRASRRPAARRRRRSCSLGRARSRC